MARLAVIGLSVAAMSADAGSPGFLPSQVDWHVELAGTGWYEGRLILPGSGLSCLDSLEWLADTSVQKLSACLPKIQVKLLYSLSRL